MEGSSRPCGAPETAAETEMSINRRNARIPLRSPSESEIVKLAEIDHIQLSAEESAMLAPVISRMVATIEDLTELTGLEPPRSPFRDRDSGHRPTPEEDPWNAFIRICDVPG